MRVTSREIVLVLLVLGLGLLVWSLVPTEEDRIRGRLEDAAAALEREEIRGVMAVIDTGRFSDAYGGTTAADIENGLVEAFALFDDLEVTMDSPRIRIEKDERKALVTLKFVVMGTHEGQHGFVAGARGESAMARFVMQKSPEAGWRVTELTAALLPGM